MNKEFVPYNESLELKELGFDEPCLAAYFVFGDAKIRDGYYGQTEPELFINGIGKELEDRMEELKMFAYCASLVPTFSQAFRFFREKYELFCWIEKFHVDETYIFQIPPANFTKIQGHYITYEEAELACLRKLIEIAKQK